MSSKVTEVVGTFITALLVIALWFCFATLGSSIWVPSPVEVLTPIGKPQWRASVIEALLNSITVVGKSVIIGCLLGYILGLLVGLFRTWLAGLYHFANATKSTPVTVLLPIFILVWGLDGFLVPLVATPIAAIMLANVAESLSNLSEQRLALAEVHKVQTFDVVRHIVLWETAEPVFATLRVVVPFGLALEVAIDYFININQGIGTVISQYYSSYQVESMYAAIILVALCGIFLVFLVDWIDSKVLAWKRDT